MGAIFVSSIISWVMCNRVRSGAGSLQRGGESHIRVCDERSLLLVDLSANIPSYGGLRKKVVTKLLDNFFVLVLVKVVTVVTCCF